MRHVKDSYNTERVIWIIESIILHFLKCHYYAFFNISFHAVSHAAVYEQTFFMNISCEADSAR